MGKKANKRKKNKRKKTSAANRPGKNPGVDIAKLKEAVDSSGADEQYERIYRILGMEDEGEEGAAVNYENLEKYLSFLKKELELPVLVTGIEDLGCFSWEEFYVWGPGSQAEYEKLKKKYPSFEDEYELSSFREDFEIEEGLSVDARRVSDGKKFVLTLADLETVEKGTRTARLLDDYAVWHTNFRF